jgi:hypothetical protein
MSSDSATPIEGGELQLSVVLAATHDSPTLRAAIETHEAGLAIVGGELLIADGTVDGLPGEIETVVHIPDGDVFELRAAAVSAAKGRIVAITEDHCVPAEDWHSAIVDAHDRYWDAAAVGGTMINGSTWRVIDNANFLVTFGSFLPPLSLRHPSDPTPVVNVSIKRASLVEFDLVPGMLEMEIGPHMYRVGAMVQDESVKVTHFQSHGFRSTFGAHFHNGRSTAGLPFRRPPARELAIRTAHNLALPFLLLRSLGRTARGKLGHRREFVNALPLIILLIFAHAAGELVGTLFGPGDSPKHLE